MKMFSLVCVCACALLAAPVSAGQAAAPKKAPAAAAKTGEKLRVVLKAIGQMPKIAMGHNFVLLKTGVSPMEVSNAAFNARATDFIPAEMKDKIIAHTTLAGGGETVEVTFTAPAKPGKYDYLCTFP